LCAKVPSSVPPPSVKVNRSSTLQNPSNALLNEDLIKIPPQRLGDLGEFRDHCRSRIESRHHAYMQGHPLGPLVGISTEFSREFGGYFDEGLTVLHAEPGSGKSALASQIAVECGCPCLYVSFEMGREVLINRHLARENDEYLGKFRSGEMSPNRWDNLFDNAFERLRGILLIYWLFSIVLMQWFAVCA
jgi:replicative DNA helicase